MRLIERFNPLFKKYANRLNYEDAYNDLQLDFLCALRKMNLGKMRNYSDGAMVKYIQIVLHHAYVKRLEGYIATRKYTIPFCSLSGEQILHIDDNLKCTDQYHSLMIMDLRNILSLKEYQIVIACCLQGYRASEIAEKTHITRQAVNQIKHSALRKIRKNQIEGSN